MWQVGEIFEVGPIQLSRDDIVRYAGASGDFNPIHYDEERAQGFGLPGVIAHGMLSMGVLARVLGEVAPSGFQLERYGVRFQAMVEPHDALTATVRLTTLHEDGTAHVDLALAHADGRKALSGTADLRLKDMAGKRMVS